MTTTATPSHRPAARSARNPQRDFLELSRRMKDAGLMARRPGWYLARGRLLAAGFAGAAALLLTLGPSLGQPAVAAPCRARRTQASFLGPGAAHQQGPRCRPRARLLAAAA